MLGSLRRAFNNTRAVVLAIIVHLAVLGLLVVNMSWDVAPISAPQSAPIQAQVVERELIEKELADIKRRKEEKIAAEKEKRRKEESLKKQRRAEKIAAAKEKKRKEEDRKAREAEKRAAAEKEKRLKEEQARKAKEAEERALAAEKEKQRQQKEEAAKRAAEQQRQEALALALQAEENAEKIGHFEKLIQADVENNWRIPPTAKKGLQCKMLIRLLPSGEVRGVHITQSSGDPIFDQSAERAVWKASPLPVTISSAGQLFNEFREFDFLFNPED